MIVYRRLNQTDIFPAMFASFQRRQEVTHCWRKEKGQWVVKPIAFVDDWSEDDRAFLIQCLRNTLSTGGMVAGAFSGERLVGFVSVESTVMGRRGQYLALSSLHVSQEMRGQGIGRKLFAMAKEFAREKGAEKLYISSHSCVESQAFYKSMGCVEAEEYDPEHVRREPCDCQIECKV